jgi:hypothetical protein
VELHGVFEVKVRPVGFLDGAIRPPGGRHRCVRNGSPVSIDDASWD